MSTSDPAFVPGAHDGGGDMPDSPPDPHLRPVGALPADGGSPLEWSDLLYLVIFYGMGEVLLLFLVTSIAGAVFHIPQAALQDASSAAQVTVVAITLALLAVATLSFLYLLVRARSAMPFWAAVGWREEAHKAASRATLIAQYIFVGVGLAFAAILLGKYLDSGTKVPMDEFFRNRQSVVLMMVLGILVAPLLEETVFRGCIYPVIARTFGVPASVLATGTLFGLAHAEQLWGAWGQIALLILVGIVLTYVRARAGTVVASYCVHIGYNAVLFTGLYFATGGLRYFSGA